MDEVIRPAEEKDAESMIELLNPIIATGSLTIMSEPLSVDDQLNFIRRLPAAAVFHVAEVDGRIVGMQDVLPSADDSAVVRMTGEISTFVALDSHRRGVGRWLFRATCAAIGQRGYESVRATVRRDNPGAIAFYKSLSFATVETTRLERTGDVVEQVVLQFSVPDSRNE